MTADTHPGGRTARFETLDELTLEWRQFQFARLGFANADEMARSNVDWHEAEALIAAGADPEQVSRILL